MYQLLDMISSVCTCRAGGVATPAAPRLYTPSTLAFASCVPQNAVCLQSETEQSLSGIMTSYSAEERQTDTKYQLRLWSAL